MPDVSISMQWGRAWNWTIVQFEGVFLKTEIGTILIPICLTWWWISVCPKWHLTREIFFKGHGYLLKPSKDKSNLLQDFPELSFEARRKNILKFIFPNNKQPRNNKQTNKKRQEAAAIEKLHCTVPSQPNPGTKAFYLLFPRPFCESYLFFPVLHIHRFMRIIFVVGPLLCWYVLWQCSMCRERIRLSWEGKGNRTELMRGNWTAEKIINKMQFNVILFRNVDSLVSTLSGRKIAVSGGFITSSTPGRIITWRCYRNIPSVFKTSCSIWFFSTWSEQAWSHLQTKQYSFKFWRVIKSVLVIEIFLAEID